MERYRAKHHQLMLEDGCPDFLLRSPGERKAPVHKAPVAPPPVDPVETQQAELRALHAEKDKHKTKRRIERMKDKLANKDLKPGKHVWDAVRCKWMEV